MSGPESVTVTLTSGGTVTLAIDVEWLKLSPADFAWILSLVELLHDYESQSSGASVVYMIEARNAGHGIPHQRACRHCGRSFHLRGVTTHERTCPSARVWWTCADCGTRFDRKLDLRRHLGDVHDRHVLHAHEEVGAIA